MSSRPALRSAEPSTPYEQLPPGPCGLSPDLVASHQRSRLHLAMIEVAADRGYGATTVRELTKLAGISTRTFYEHYTGKHECFLSTYELILRRTALHIVLAQSHELDWSERVRQAFHAFAREVVREPKAARLVLLEPFSAGPIASEHMEHSRDLLARMITKIFALKSLTTHPLIAIGIAGGLIEVVRNRLLDGRVHELTELADEMTDWTLSYSSTAASFLLEDSLRGPKPCRSEGVVWPGPIAADRTPHNGLHWTRGDGFCSTRGDGLHSTRDEPGEADRAGRREAYDRAYILRAALEVACAEGPLQLTAAKIAADAGVSTRRFHELYDDCEPCLLEGLSSVCARVLANASAAGLAGGDWAEGIHRTLRAFLEQIARDTAFAEVAFVEVLKLGPGGLRCRQKLMLDLSHSLRRSAPPWCRPSPFVAEASVGAVWAVIQHQVARGRASRLPALSGPLSYLLLAPRGGAEDTMQAILGRAHRSQTSAGTSSLL